MGLSPTIQALEQSPAAESVRAPLLSGIVPVSGAEPTRFDREKAFLYAAVLLAVGMVAAFYVFGYLLPALSYGSAIMHAAKDDPNLSSGCYLLSLEHANRLQSAYSIRFLGMLIGTVISCVGMVFTIKGLEAGYSLDLNAGSSSASLKTASPGLVLCTLGIALCAAAALHTSNLSFEMSTLCLSQ
jgi:hypothetical protein